MTVIYLPVERGIKRCSILVGSSLDGKRTSLTLDWNGHFSFLKEIDGIGKEEGRNRDERDA